MDKHFVRSLLSEESFAYGFTIAFWGGGVTLINEFGIFGVVGVLEYAIGAVTGFGILAILTFQGAVDTVDADEPDRYFVLAGIHYLASLVPIIATYTLILFPIGMDLTIFLSGVSISVCYNIFAAFEELATELLWKLEKKFDID